jgi:predicted PhzF superfamily epimerase YddE/YHI9
MRYPFHTLDVFTERKLGGNPLAVVLDAATLSGAQMQALTREFNLSETAFVMAPDVSAHTAKVRIFFPGGEMPFAGHPTLGTAALVDPLAPSDAAYVYTPGGDASGTAFRARMFAPTGGIPEAPATGPAAALMAAKLLTAEGLRDGTHRWPIEQGCEMGCPSDITLEADVVGGRLIAVRVGGNVVQMMSGMLEL